MLQLFDGHNGNGAAIYTKENLLNNILNAVPADLNREDWLAALPRALVAAFVKTDKDFQTKGMLEKKLMQHQLIFMYCISINLSSHLGSFPCLLSCRQRIKKIEMSYHNFG